MDESVTLSLKSGLEYLLRFAETKSWEIPSDLQKRISVLHRKQLHDELMSVKSFTPDITKYKEDYKKAILAAILLYAVDPAGAELMFDFGMATAFANTFLSSWVDGGASLPVNHDSSVWLSQREEQERKYVTALFVSLALLLKRPDFDINSWASTRADGYLSTLSGISAIGTLRAKIASGHGEDLYEFQGVSGVESCKECQDMLGKKMTAKEIIEQDLIPYAGTSLYSCHGYRCEHFFADSGGKVLSA